MIALLLASALAQQGGDTTASRGPGRPCIVAIDSIGGSARQMETPSRDTNYFAGGGVLAHCQGAGSSLSADSVAHYGAPGRFDMIGRVQIRDTALALDANVAAYFLREERLEAHNKVVAVNRRNGSVLRGPNLTYYRAVQGVRDTLEMYATSRPTIDYRAAGDTGEPYVIVADRVRFKGDDRIWAAGRVTVDRSDLAARADSMLLDEAAGSGVLLGSPRVEGRGDRPYTLVGRRIELGLDQREIHLAKALGAGAATGTDWRLTADTIQLAVERGKLQQAFAWGDSSRPYTVSARYTILSDSLALDLPDEVLTEARAFGRTLSTSKRDSTAAEAERSWLAGDSLTASFAQEVDSTGASHAQLRLLVARGSARAFTHLYDERDSTAAPSLNYSRGERIAIGLLAERIDRVVVSGRADGLHLEPLPPAPPAPPAAPVAADTTKRGGAP